MTNRTIWTLDEAKTAHRHSKSLAELLPAFLDKRLPIIDLGCGLGYYLKYLSEKGYTVYGLEGTKGINKIALWPSIQQDLSLDITLPLPQSNVLSFEVGEHLLPSQESIFINNLTKFCKKRLIVSWAIPGQCGIGHYNCRPNNYIINKIEEKGFSYNSSISKSLRDGIKEEDGTFWYKDTLMCFDKKD